jgi:hypothetical protein
VTPLGIIRRAQADTLIDEDGDVVALELLSGLSHAELRDFARRVPCFAGDYRIARCVKWSRRNDR